MDNLLKNYMNEQSSDDQDSSAEKQKKNLLSQSDDDLYQDDSNDQNSQKEDDDQDNHQEDDDDKDLYQQNQYQSKQKLPSFEKALALQQQSKDKPKYLQNCKQSKASEFDLLYSFKQVKQQIAEEPKPLIVQQVIEKKGYQSTPDIGAIEKRIEDQNKKENPFKKSALVKTNYEVRDIKRTRMKAKNERNENRRKVKQGEKEEEKLKKLRNQL